MTRIGLAFRLFFRALGNKDFADRAEVVLRASSPAGPPSSAPAAQPPSPTAPAAPRPPARSEALNLLSALQRDARFVDFIQEPIAAYSDAQIGAAVRDVHRGCAAVLDRLFSLKPVLDQPEGGTTEVRPGFDAGRIRLTGNVAGQPPFRGTVQHAGWQATKVELPEWNGTDAAARVVAPAEVEIK